MKKKRSTELCVPVVAGYSLAQYALVAFIDANIRIINRGKVFKHKTSNTHLKICIICWIIAYLNGVVSRRQQKYTHIRIIIIRHSGGVIHFVVCDLRAVAGVVFCCRFDYLAVLIVD